MHLALVTCEVFGGRAEASVEIAAWVQSTCRGTRTKSFCNVLGLGELGVQELAFERAEGHFRALCQQMFGRG